MRYAFLLTLTLASTAAFSQIADGSYLWQRTNTGAPNTAIYSPPPSANPSVFGIDGAGVVKSLLLGDGISIVDGELVVSGGTWGSIGGTLSNQTDLMTALNAKLSVSAAEAGYQPLDADLTTLAGLALEAWGTGLLELGGGGETFKDYAGLGALSLLDAVGSVQITNASIVDADISGSAAIAVSKISGLGNLATLSAVGTTQITNGSIINEDISASAAISISKIDALQATLDLKANSVHSHAISAITGTNVNRLFGTGGSFATGQEISVSSALSLSAGSLTVASGGITDAMLAGSIALSKLSITGTPNGSKYLRDDGSWQTVTAGIGGSTGSTDNRVLRSDGTGGATAQASSMTVDDSGRFMSDYTGGPQYTYSGATGYGLRVVSDRVDIWANGTPYLTVNSSGVAFGGIVAFDQVSVGGGLARIMSNSGSPEGVVTAPIGSLYLRTDGGANTTLYVKESGVSNTGWIAK